MTGNPPPPGLERRQPIALLDLWVLAFACLYAAGLMRLYLPLTETLDGIMGITNALLLGGIEIPLSHLELIKGPMGSLVLAPFVSLAHFLGGPGAVLKTSHVFQVLCTTLFLLLTWAFFRRLFDRTIAGVLVILMAFNPILLRNAPFANHDIFGAVFALLFLWLLLRYLDHPEPRSFAWLVACGSCAFLSKYHQGVLLFVPPAVALCQALGLAKAGPQRSPGRWQPLSLWGAPFLSLALAASVLLGLLLIFREPPGPFGVFWQTVETLLKANFRGSDAGANPSFLESLRRQLGPCLFLFASCGFGLWVWRRDTRGLVSALGLGLPLLFLSFFIRTSEARYTIFLLPLVYAALGETLSFFSGGWAGRIRVLPLSLALLTAPWRQAHDGVQRLLEDPIFHSRIPFLLAQYAGIKAGAGGCFWWVQGELRIPGDEYIGYADGWTRGLVASIIQFYADVPVRVSHDYGPAPVLRLYAPAQGQGPLSLDVDFGSVRETAGSCRTMAVLVPKFPGSEMSALARWPDGALARLYSLPVNARNSRLRFPLEVLPHLEVTPYSLRPNRPPQRRAGSIRKGEPPRTPLKNR